MTCCSLGIKKNNDHDHYGWSFSEGGYADSSGFDFHEIVTLQNFREFMDFNPMGEDSDFIDPMMMAREIQLGGF